MGPIRKLVIFQRLIEWFKFRIRDIIKNGKIGRDSKIFKI